MLLLLLMLAVVGVTKAAAAAIADSAVVGPAAAAAPPPPPAPPPTPHAEDAPAAIGSRWIVVGGSHSLSFATFRFLFLGFCFGFAMCEGGWMREGWRERK